MFNFLLHPSNIPFAIALAVLAGVLLLELIGLLVGFSTMIDTDSGVDAALDASPSGFLTQGLDWLNVGEVPLAAWLAVFAGFFSATGYAIQGGTRMMFPTPLVAAAAVIVSVIGAREVSRVLRRTLFREDNTAISADHLVGNLATVTLGHGRRGQPTQAKVRDTYGMSHYVLVEPELDDDVFEPGSSVILLRREGPKYFAVTNSTEAVIALDNGPPSR
jgi:uncharacterized membrane protein